MDPQGLSVASVIHSSLKTSYRMIADWTSSFKLGDWVANILIAWSFSDIRKSPVFFLGLNNWSFSETENELLLDIISSCFSFQGMLYELLKNDWKRTSLDYSLQILQFFNGHIYIYIYIYILKSRGLGGDRVLRRADILWSKQNTYG